MVLQPLALAGKSPSYNCILIERWGLGPRVQHNLNHSLSKTPAYSGYTYCYSFFHQWIAVVLIWGIFHTKILKKALPYLCNRSLQPISHFPHHLAFWNHFEGEKWYGVPLNP